MSWQGSRQTSDAWGNGTLGEFRYEDLWRFQPSVEAGSQAPLLKIVVGRWEIPEPIGDGCGQAFIAWRS
jgi:hypothetical protein